MQVYAIYKECPRSSTMCELFEDQDEAREEMRNLNKDLDPRLLCEYVVITVTVREKKEKE